MGFQDPGAKPTDIRAEALEGWAEGFMVGSLFIMCAITLANMKKRVLLHKIILLELFLGFWQGFVVLIDPPVYTWYLSSASALTMISWTMHNVVAWMKIRLFLSQWMSKLFIISVIIVQPYWILEMYANFLWFDDTGDLFIQTRPLEPLFRDPWWIIGALYLPYVMATEYNLKLWEMLDASPRFGIMLGAMIMSLVFTVVDILSVTGVIQSVLPVGINPFWKLAFVFKCLTDVVILDDFKTALDRLTAVLQRRRLGVLDTDVSSEATRPHANRRRWYGCVVEGEKHEMRFMSEEQTLIPPQPSAGQERDGEIECCLPNKAHLTI